MHKIYTHIIPEKASDEVDETVFLILTAKKKKNKQIEIWSTRIKIQI